MIQFRALVAVLAVVITTGTSAQVGHYSDEPIRKPVFDSAKVVVEAVAVNNWLNANFLTLSPERYQGVREHIHALIDSRIKEIYSRDKSILPKQADPILPILFSWVGRLGVYGADVTYQAIRGTYAVVPPVGPTPPVGLGLALDGELLRINSELGGWSMSVPYYFFIFAMNDATGPDARRTQTVAVTMGTATDTAQPGYSQATLVLFFSPKAHSQGFVESWSERVGVKGLLKKKVGATAFESQSSYDSATRLHKEVVFLSGDKGSFAVVYSGLDGTYQWNRRHFIDFITGLKFER
jgi:hypothetical protein